jgi:hypothetical protein
MVVATTQKRGSTVRKEVVVENGGKSKADAKMCETLVFRFPFNSRTLMYLDVIQTC